MFSIQRQLQRLSQDVQKAAENEKVVEERQKQIWKLYENVDQVRSMYEHKIEELREEMTRLTSRENLKEVLRQVNKDQSVMTSDIPVLLQKIRPFFVFCVNPLNVLVIIHSHDPRVLVEQDFQEIQCVTEQRGNIVGSSKLLTRLVQYKGWLPCIVQVLRDDRVRRSHVADIIEEVVECSESDEHGCFSSEVKNFLEEKMRQTSQVEMLQKSIEDLKDEMQEKAEQHQRELENKERLHNKKVEENNVDHKNQIQCLTRDYEKKLHVERQKEETHVKKLTEERQKQETQVKKLTEERQKQEIQVEKLTEERQKQEIQIRELTEEINLQKKKKESADKEIVGDAPGKPHLADLDNRFKTFKDWPEDSPVFPRALAKAGFYHDTDSESSSLPLAPDCCRCFYCGVRIDGWKSDDDPFVEHALPRVTCPFITQCKGEAFIQAAQKLAKNGGQVTKKQVKVEISAAGQKKKTTGAECGVMACRPESDSSILDRADCVKRPIMNQLRETDLLLVGKIGNGKSATGNSILRHKGSKPFKTKASARFVTTVTSAEVTEYNGRLIRVVDSLGVGDKRDWGLNIVLEGLQKAILLNDRGYHAFLLVLRFGGRFTEEDSNAVELLKGYFGGPTFLKNYCILVFTCGDNFEDETEDSGQTFKEWCNSQDGILKKLIDDCNGRVILFDNRTKDKAKQSKQLDELLKTVDTLTMQGRRYCDEQFELAKEGREKAIVNLQKPQIEKEMMEKTSLIIQKLNNLGTTDDPKNNRGPLNELKKAVNSLYEYIKLRDKQTGVLHDIIEAAEGLRRVVYSRFEVCEVMITMAENLDAKRQKNKREF